MTQEASIQDRINGTYADLSEKLQIAAKYVADNPVDVATRSLRSVATTSGVSPATFSRLARALGYDDYEQLREDGRAAVERQVSPFAQRASELRTAVASQEGGAILQAQASACMTNIETLCRDIESDRLDRAVQTLHDAERVVLVGSMGSSGLIDYLGYMSQWFKSNWLVAGRNGVELAATLSRLTPNDAVLALAKQPYARRSVSALKEARHAGAKTIAITDSRTAPILQFADHSFIVSAESPQFFSSYAATLVLMETIISMLIARSGPEAEDMIRAAELNIERLGENWAP